MKKNILLILLMAGLGSIYVCGYAKDEGACYIRMDIYKDVGEFAHSKYSLVKCFEMLTLAECFSNCAEIKKANKKKLEAKVIDWIKCEQCRNKDLD